MSTDRRGQRRSSKPGGKPWFGITMVVFGSILALTSGSAFVYTKSLFSTIEDSVPTENLLGGEEDPGADIEGPLNLLLLGNDHRENNDEGDKIGRTDTILMMHVNKDLTEAAVISVPRDLLVTIPDCGNGVECESKVNDAYPLGGEAAAPGEELQGAVQNLAATLTDLTGIETFDGAGLIKFDGFMELVKTFGTVELCIPFEMEVVHTDNDKYELGPNGGRMIPKGCNEYTRGVALAIVRERYAYGPHTPGWTEEWGMGDFGRQQMQQHFIKQLLKRAKDEGYMSDPTKVGPLVEAIGDQLLMDIGGRSVVDYAFALSGVDISNMLTLRLPSESAEIDGTSYVVTQEGEQQEQADALFEAMRNDTLDQWATDNPEWTNNSA
ncbi:MAG: LCP family protein [Stackebrandtia sp.]